MAIINDIDVIILFAYVVSSLEMIDETWPLKNPFNNYTKCIVD